MDGSCVLCYDLHHAEPTPNFHTRIFRTRSPTLCCRRRRLRNPSPPPRPPPPPPPPAPDVDLPMGGDRMAACTFTRRTSRPTNQAASASDEQTAKAASASASAMAGGARRADDERDQPLRELRGRRQLHRLGVYEHASKVCVALPPARSLRLVPRYNGGMTSGFVPPHQQRPRRCRRRRPPVPADARPGLQWCARRQDRPPPRCRAASSWRRPSYARRARQPRCTSSPSRSTRGRRASATALFRAIAEPFKKEGEGLVGDRHRARRRRALYRPARAAAGRRPPDAVAAAGAARLPALAALDHGYDMQSQFGAAGAEDGDETGIDRRRDELLGAALVICLVTRWVHRRRRGRPSSRRWRGRRRGGPSRGGKPALKARMARAASAAYPPMRTTRTRTTRTRATMRATMPMNRLRWWRARRTVERRRRRAARPGRGGARRRRSQRRRRHEGGKPAMERCGQRRRESACRERTPRGATDVKRSASRRCAAA